MYKQIRIGRGHSIHDYQDNSVLNKVSEKKPDDYDSYGIGWKEDKSQEFSFCSPECLIKFLTKLYQDTYSESLERIKKEKKETLNVSFEEFKKKHGTVISFFKKIQTTFSKKVFEESALKEADDLIKDIKEIKKLIKGENV